MNNDRPPFFKKFTRGYTFKVLLLVALVLLLLIPLNMIRGLVDDREHTANSAEADIMEAWGSQLVAAGPIVIIPGTRTEEIRTKTEKEGEKIELAKNPFTLAISPQKLNIEAAFKTETRKRGIFSVPLFSGTLRLSGAFDPAPALSGLAANEAVYLNQAELVIALSSQKGIRKINTSTWDGEDLFFKPGNRGYSLFSGQGGSGRSRTGEGIGGIYAGISQFQNRAAAFDISIEIRGGQYIRFLPVGQDTHAAVSADWGAPSFQGAYLPGESAVGDTDFSALWDINYLSRDIPLFWKDYGERQTYSGSLFGVNFFRAVDAYALNTRAVKYAVLFLTIPFLTLFLLEIFTKKRIHPAPYLLSGIANAVFYLLLLSLSEQIPFYTAYLIAALAVTAMMTLYSRSLLPSWNKSWYMGLTVSISYILLYAVLNAQSYALLIGSIGTFVVLALIMFLTRKLDWYREESESEK
ncbi:MAG: cell envelope integrity protein CreD [Treponema sp.]|jgi:inner membrane protein|nr:cell envelope integrity protein CreD [Treponema sp.]